MQAASDIKKVKKFSGRDIEKTCYKFCYSFKVDSLIFGAADGARYIKISESSPSFVEEKMYTKFVIRNS